MRSKNGAIAVVKGSACSPSIPTIQVKSCWNLPFFSKSVDEKNKNKQKETGVVPFKTQIDAEVGKSKIVCFMERPKRGRGWPIGKKSPVFPDVYGMKISFTWSEVKYFAINSAVYLSMVNNW